jgi:DNA-binding CsgD family transcriptional regulator
MAISNTQYEELLSVIDICNNVHRNKDIEPIWLKLRSLCCATGLIMSVSEGPNANQIANQSTFVYGLPLRWMENYKRNNLALIDPLVKMAKRKENNNRVVNWRKAFDNSPVTIDKITGMEHDSIDGYAIFSRSHNYTHASSMTSITVESENITEAQKVMLHKLIPHIHRILERPGFLKGPNITKREKQILKAAGKLKSFTYDSVGEKMGITGRTAKHHFTNLRKKLQVDDNYIVIEKARLMGMVK